MHSQTESCNQGTLKDVEQSGTWSSREELAVCTANCVITCLERNDSNGGTSIYERNYSQMQLESCGRSSRGANATGTDHPRGNQHDTNATHTHLSSVQKSFLITESWMHAG